MAQLKPMVNTLERKFTAWESKGKMSPSEISGHQYDNIKVLVNMSLIADVCLSATQNGFCTHSEL